MKNSLKMLMNYLQDIIEHPDTATLNLDEISPDFQELGEQATVLAHALNHLISQLQQKAEFVEMENQVLMDNIQAMNEIGWSLEQSNQELRNNLALVNALTDYTHNMIFVYSVDTGEEVHTNQPAKWFQKAHAYTAGQLVQKLLDKQPEIQQQIEQQGKKCGEDQNLAAPQNDPHGENQGHQNSVTWNLELKRSNGTDIFFQVESFLIPWLDSDAENPSDTKEQAIVHIVLDETERQRRQKLIYRFAYIDPLTRLTNRRYAIEKMEQWLQEGTPFVLSFIDVDYLKYCNDTFGHEQGDHYLIEIAKALHALGGEVCRVGGDEFFLLQTGSSPEEQDQKLEKLRQMILADKSSGYPKCFSYASNLIPAHPDVPLDTYINDTDAKMYQYKQKYKLPLSDVVYKDDRI